MIEIKNLSKTFGSIKALDNINLTIESGEIVALLGPNGSGKTTLMRCLTGFIEQDKGSVSIFGKDTQAQRTKALKHIGYSLENAALYPDMTVFEFLKFCANMWDIPKDSINSSIKRTTKALNLENVITQKIDSLSKGFKKRVGIASAHIHNPEIVILDEPTEGLDPNQKLDLRELIKEQQGKKIILLSTHIMEEVSALATRVILIHKGKIIKDAPIAEIAKEGDIYKYFKLLTK